MVEHHRSTMSPTPVLLPTSTGDKDGAQNPSKAPVTLSRRKRRTPRWQKKSPGSYRCLGETRDEKPAKHLLTIKRTLQHFVSKAALMGTYSGFTKSR